MKTLKLVRSVADHRYAKAAVAACVALAAVSAHAVTDITASVTELGDVKVAVLGIGVAVLSIVIGIKLYKWITRAL